LNYFGSFFSSSSFLTSLSFFIPSLSLSLSLLKDEVYLFLFPSLAARRWRDETRCDVGFALGLVVLEGYYYVADQDDVCYEGGGGAGVG
jgi:hypothetical protein